MFTINDKYSRHNRENLPLPIQMQLSKKSKSFCYLESKLNFEHFEKILNPIASVFLKLLTPKSVVNETHETVSENSLTVNVLNLPVPIPDKEKNYTSLWCLKRFYKGLMKAFKEINI